MALQDTASLTSLARMIRENARGMGIRANTLQSALFGSEPQPPQDNAKPHEETVEGLLREAHYLLSEAEAQFARTISRVTEQEVTKLTGIGGTGYGGGSGAAVPNVTVQRW